MLLLHSLTVRTLKRVSISASSRVATAKTNSPILRPAAVVWLPACVKLREWELHYHFFLQYSAKTTAEELCTINYEQTHQEYYIFQIYTSILQTVLIVVIVFVLVVKIIMIICYYYYYKCYCFFAVSFLGIRSQSEWVSNLVNKRFKNSITSSRHRLVFKTMSEVQFSLECNCSSSCDS